MDLNTELKSMPGIGPILAKRLEKLQLFSLEDLIKHYPFRYDDFSKVSQIIQIKTGETVTIIGDIWSIKNSYTRFRKVLTKAIINDGTGSVECIWFNQPWLSKSLQSGTSIRLSGTAEKKGSKLFLIAPEWEKSDAPPLHTGRLVPIYPETYGISSKWLRSKIAHFLPQLIGYIEDPLPKKILNDLTTLNSAINDIHFPQNLASVKNARDRLAFDELFYIQLATLKKRSDWQEKQAMKRLIVSKVKQNQFIKSLPFKLTTAQERVTEEILNDLTEDTPMNRLIQGEVGSGKTVVAAIIMYMMYLNKLKSVFMAPTEILAFQHYDTLKKLLEPFGISIGIYTGSKKSINSKTTSKLQPDIIVGTHALLSNKLKLDKIGLVVVDEQQRFGVAQRSTLRDKPKVPHFLTMTATPIPRTVALTIFGDLDLSIIDQLPVGRKGIKTYFVPKSKRSDSYNFMSQHIDKGDQIYIITPLIEESETLATVKAATAEYAMLKQQIFPKYRVGLLHGRMKSKEKEQVLADFKNHDLDILVSTSVVEVGVDIPNATIMVIEGAERFGLAQLHQLRGRVGRGDKQSYVFLFTETELPQTIQRLKKLETTNNGLELAELDLKIRGSGEIFGYTQSGRLLTKFASLSNLELIEQTRKAAQIILSEGLSLDKYPLLSAKLSDMAGNAMPD